MGVVHLLQILRWRWPIIASSVVAMLLAAGMGLMVLPNRYVATSRLLVGTAADDPTAAPAMTGPALAVFLQTQLELVRDYRVAGRVVDKLGWLQSPDLAAAYQAQGNPNIDFRRWLAQTVIDNCGVSVPPGSNIFEFSFEASNPEAARVIADALRDAYVDQTLAFKHENAARTAQSLHAEADKLLDRYRAAVARRIDYERAHHLTLTASGDDPAQLRLAALSAATPQAKAGSAPVGSHESGTQLQLASLDAHIAQLASILGPQHPQLVALQRTRAAIAAALPKGARGSVPAAGPAITAQIAEQTQKVLSVGDSADEAKRLRSDAKLLSDQYFALVARANFYDRLTESADTGLTVLSDADLPVRPIWPKRWLIIAGALGLGTLVGVLLAVIAELISRRVRDAADARLLGIPVIGEDADMPPEPRLAA